MTDLSSLIGFGTGGGGSSVYEGSILLDFESFTMNDESRNLGYADLNNYGQPIRIRGLDTNTEAFFGFNCATFAGTTPFSGNMNHTAILFSVNQTTGAITKKGSAALVTTTQSSDYSTFVGTSDEWSGRYTYSGNIPRSGSSGHQYGYNQGLIMWNGSSVTVTGTNATTSTYYPAGNSRETSSYVAPSERRFGGAATHMLTMYSASGSYATAVQFSYGYSTSSINATTTYSSAAQVTTTSTNYNGHHFWQWNVTNEPYYDYFQSMPNGLWARTRSTGTWALFQSGSLDQYSNIFHLSNGNLVVYFNGQVYMVTSGGTKTTITSSTTLNPAADIARYSSYGNNVSVFNIGTDEWLAAGVAAQYFFKFTINPTTGVVTISNVVQSTQTLFQMIPNSGIYKYGWMNLSGSGNYSTQMFTYGNENILGAGYGRSKIVYVGGTYTGPIYAVSYDPAPILDLLTYP